MAQKESLVIKNFGPVTDIEIPEIAPYLFLIGESGSGKSTILKVLAMMRHMYKQINLRSYLKLGNVIDRTIELNFSDYLHNGDLDDYKKETTVIIYKKGSCELEYSKGKLKGSNIIIGSENLSLEKISFLSDKRGSIASLLANRSKGEDLGFYFTETYNDFKLATEHIKKIEIKFLDIRYDEIKSGNGTRQYFIRGIDNPYKINFEGASSGMQTVTPLAIIAEYYSKKFNIVETFNESVLRLLGKNDSLSAFRHDMNIGDIPNKTVHLIIEEPELSLFPTAQRFLINDLIRKCQEGMTYMTLAIATHSPYVINHLNLLFKAHDKGLTIDGASLDFEKAGLYLVQNGLLQNLKLKNTHLINTDSLSDDINAIYNEYDKIDKL